ncbi:hypothetical protein [Tenacibaculum xiamenense]|uniref:hypothetical protein n=1 Tax=Tenacibaculum xiamenense TaxID=1261553 RepID=UPI0038B45F46
MKSILENENFMNINSIAEIDPSRNQLDEEYKTFVSRYLKIKDLIHLEKEFELYKNFKITPEMVNFKKLIAEEKINDFTKLAGFTRDNDYKYIDWLISNGCKYGFGVISRPIFNEEYNMAIIRLETVCGPLCGGGLIAIYKLHNEEWAVEKILDRWVN